MMHYSTEPGDQIFVKDYEFWSFAKNKGNNLVKNISKNLSEKYSQKLFDYAKNLQQMHLKLLQKSNSKIAGATSDLIRNKIAAKITKVPK